MGDIQAQIFDNKPDIGHWQLVQSLYTHLSGQDVVAVPEPALSSRYLNDGVVPIPDVLTIKPSYTRPVVTIYEVKVSRSDFQSDTRNMKWKRYWELCNRLYFACPAGMLKPFEIPDGAGLIVLTKNGSWSVTKGAATHDGGLGEEELLSLLFAKHRNRFTVRSKVERQRAFENGQFDDFAFSEAVKAAIQRGYDFPKEDEERRKQFIKVLGLSEDAKHSWYDIYAAVKDMKTTAAITPQQLKAFEVIDGIGTFLRTGLAYRLSDEMKQVLGVPVEEPEEKKGR